jgi:hypothetical protein
MISELTRLLNSAPARLASEVLGLTGLCAAIVALFYLPALT